MALSRREKCWKTSKAFKAFKACAYQK